MKGSLKRVLGISLAVVLLFTSIPLGGFAAQGNPNKPFRRSDPANAWSEIAAQSAVILKSPRRYTELDGLDLGGVEVYHDRSTRTYLLEDGSYTTRIFDDPLTYIDGKGDEWDIDNTLVPDGAGYTNKANAYGVTLPIAGEGVALVNEGKKIEIIPLFGTLANGVVQGNAIRYNSVAQGVDLQYTATGIGVKEDIILNRPVDLTSFSYELKASGVTFVLENNTVYGYARNADEPLITITAPIMADASGMVSQGITLSLAKDGFKDILTVSPDAEWLAAPERAYPVVVDPSWTLQRNNLTIGVIQAYGFGGDYGPDVQHLSNPYLYTGLEDGSLVAVGGIVYGQTWSYIRMDDISQYIEKMPDVAILDVKLKAYKYADQASGQSKMVDAKMIASDWRGNGRYTWNNRPEVTDLANGQDASGSSKWLEWDISDAFREWKRVPSSNRGIMLTPRSEAQPAVCFSGTGNQHGQQALYIDVNWTVPNPVDENLPLDAPIPKLWVLSNKAMYSGKLNVTGVFATGVVRPGLRVDYALNEQDGGTYDFAEYGKIWPDTTEWENAGIPMTLGYHELYEGNWQTKLFQVFFLNTLYSVYAQGTLPATDTEPEQTTPVGKSDDFIIYQFRETDTLPYVADYYGVSRDQIVKDNRTGSDLAHPGNTIFIRNPQRNATIPYSRPDNLSLQHMRDIIYASMGVGMCSEFDMEPVNMNNGNFYFESVDAENTEYNGTFRLARSYNSLGAQSLGLFGRGWAFAYQQFLTGREDGGMNYRMGDGKQIVFPRTGENTWSSPVGYALTLQKIGVEDPEDEATWHAVQYKITDADGTVYLFDSYGILRSVTDARGFVTQLHYDASYRLSDITTGSGRSYGFRQNAAGQVIEVTLPNSGKLQYEYDADGYLTAYINADGDRVRYTYDGNGQMSEWFDGNGNRVIKNEYDSQGRVIRQTDAAGGVSTLTYSDGQTLRVNAEGAEKTYEYDDQLRTKKIDDGGNDIVKTFNSENQLTAQTEKTGKATTYAYDSKGNVSKETRSDGAYREITYNARNLPTRIRDYDGAVTLNDYDADGNLIKATQPDGSTVTYTYDQYGRTTSITDGEGNTTGFAYNALSSMVMTDPLGNKTTCYYDAVGRLINEVDALGIEHKTMYSPGGKKLGVWQTGGISEEYKFDGAGNCVEIIDANGNKSVFAYNAQTQITKATNPLGAAVSYTYDKLGQKLSETDSQGNITRYEYDDIGNLTKVTDALGNSERSEYDAVGRLAKTVDKNGNAVTYSYDDTLNLLTSVTTPSGTMRYGYDVCGRLSEIDFPDGTKELRAYDTRGRLSRVTAANGLVTDYSYNTNGQITQVTDNTGRVSVNEYDACGNLVKSTDPMNRVSVYEYDAIGRLVKQTLPGGLSTVYTYDEAGNITLVERPDGKTVKFGYDKNGNLLTQEDAAGNRTEYRYNAVNDLLAQIDALNGTQTFTYADSQLLIEQTAELGQKTKYEYDKFNRPSKVTDPNGNATLFEYDANGNVTAIIAADSSYRTTEYTADNQIAKITDAEGFATQYLYDSMGRKVKEWDNADWEMTFRYNAAGLLSGQTDALGRTSAYTYDLLGNLTHSVDFNGEEVSYTYDKLSRPTSATDNEGKTTRFTYDAAGNLIEQLDGNGRSNKYEYDKLGQLIKAIDPANQATEYSYDAVGNLTRVDYPNDSDNRYTYDALGRPLTLQDGNGNKTHYEYDASGRLIKQTDVLGGYTEYIYDPAGKVTRAKDPMGNVTQYSYDSLLRLVSVKSPKGAETKYTYNGQGKPLTETDALGGVIDYAYFLNGNLETKTLPNGLTYNYTYDAIGRVIKTANSAGQFSVLAYDAAGNLASETDQSGRVTGYAYDDMHRLLQSTNPKGDVTRMSYDAAGNLARITSPKGYQTNFQYDVLDRMTRVQDPVGRIEEYTYDPVGNVTKSVLNGTRQNTFAYDGNGNLLSATNPRGQAQKYSYDGLNRLTRQTDYANNAYSYSYDANGNTTQVRDKNDYSTSMAYDAHNNLVSVTDGAQRSVGYTYDLLDRLTSVREGDKTTANYRYDAVGNLTAYTDGTGKTTAYAYNLLGQMTEIKDPLGNVKRFAYNINTMLASMTNADGSAVNYDYDQLDQLLAKTYDEEQQAVGLYGFDSEGNRVQMTDVAGTSNYEYDAAGRVTAVVLQNGTSKITYTYDEFGNLAKLGYPDGTSVSYAYDELDRMTSITDRQGKVTAYEYDRQGNLVKVARPNQTSSELRYDDMGNVTEVKNFRPIKFFGFIRVSTKVAAYSYAYDGAGFITSEKIDDYSDHPARGFFTWLLQIFYKNNIDTKYTYDERGQLVESEQKEHRLFRSDTVTTTYTYDGAGNRLSKSISGNRIDSVTEAYAYDDADQITQVARTVKDCIQRANYTYDANGNLVNTKELDTLCKDERTFTYNNENRLMAVKENGTLLMAALYDGDGERIFTVNRKAGDYVSNGGGSVIRKDFPACDQTRAVDYNTGLIADEMLIPNGVRPIGYAGYELTGYINDTNRQYSQVLMEYGASQRIVNYYDYGAAGRNSVSGMQGKYFYDYDGRGSVVGLTRNDNSNTAVSYSYDDSGTAKRCGANRLVNNPYTYNGEYTDLAVGMQYLRAREYNPATGSFTNRDSYLGTASNPLSRNGYTYAHNNPVNYQDPSGHSINEIFDLYLGTTINNNIGRANAAFYGQLNYAANVDYQNIDAINGISGISQGTANYYINQGASQARSIGQTWNCSPGALTNQAVGQMTAYINASKNSVNSQIANVKAQKKTQYNEWRVWVADTAKQIREAYGITDGKDDDYVIAHVDEYYRKALSKAANEIRTAYNIQGPYSDQYIVDNQEKFRLKEEARLIAEAKAAAEARRNQGILETVLGGLAIVGGVIAVVATAGLATPIFVAGTVAYTASLAYGLSEIVQGGQDIYYGAKGDITTKSINPLRDTVFQGNQDAYNLFGTITMIGTTLVTLGAGGYAAALQGGAKAAGSYALNAAANIVIGAGAGYLGEQTALALGADPSIAKLIGIGTGTVATSLFNLYNNQNPTKTSENANEKLHGNSLETTKEATGYALRDIDTNEVLKYGETTRGTSRYTREFYNQTNSYMDTMATGTKYEMHFWQHDMIMEYNNLNGVKPPLNKSFW